MRFINSDACQMSGLSFVDVEHKGKIYTGWAERNYDDEWSEYTGCRYAHMRAEIKALKADYRQKKHDVKICEQFVAKIEQYTRFNAEEASARVMYRQLNMKRKELIRMGNEISKRESALKKAIEEQDKFNEKIKEKKDVKND